MTKQDHFQRLYAAITHFYYSNHGSKPFGITLFESPQVCKVWDADLEAIVEEERPGEFVDYCRHSWRNFGSWMLYEFSKPQYGLAGHTAHNIKSQRCPRGFFPPGRLAADQRASAVEIIKEECAYFGMDTRAFIRRLIAAITRQYRDAVHHSWVNKRIPSHTEHLVQALIDLNAPMWDRLVPGGAHGKNDGRSSGFEPHRFGFYNGAGPDWFDQHLFGAGSCAVLAAELCRNSDWTWDLMQERQPNTFFGQDNIHAWALRPDGRAVDIWGVRDGEWAAGYLHKKLDKPFGELAPNEWLKRGHSKELRIEAQRVIASYPEFFGIEEMRMAA